MSITSDRIKDYGFIHALADDAAEEIEILEKQLDIAIEALEKLSKLGNVNQYGNSDGNILAQKALAKIKGVNYTN